MAVGKRRDEVFENLLRLRRVGQTLSGNADVAAVRLSLERELGEAVSQRFAASMLGVSHTALSRWVRAGDLPVVVVADGRQQVPVPALLELVEAVRAASADEPVRHVLASTMLRRRDAAGRLRRAMVAEAWHVLQRWRADERIDAVYADRWERILALPFAEMRAAITEVGGAGDDLRQNSPFAGALTEPERRRILELVT